MLRAKEILSAPVNCSTEGEHSSVPINSQTNNQSVHTLPKKCLEELVYENGLWDHVSDQWQRKILLRFCRSYVFLAVGEQHISDIWHPGTRDTVSGLVHLTSKPHSL